MSEYTTGEPDIRKKLESIKMMKENILRSPVKNPLLVKRALERLEEEEKILKSAPPVSEMDDYELLGYYDWLKRTEFDMSDPFFVKKHRFDLNLLEKEIKRRGLR